MKKGLFNHSSYSELSLLVLFAAGLFFANLIVRSRSQIQLSPGYVLPGSGVTVHWPGNKGWQGLTQWQLEQKNRLVLPARSAHPAVDVQWVYDFSTSAVSSEAALDLLAAEFGGTVVDKQATKGTTPMQFGRFMGDPSLGQCYLGAVVLDFGRLLTLRVQSQEELFYASEIFMALAESVQYKKPAELAAGVELIEAMRRLGTANLFADRHEQNLMIVDAAGGVRGYERTLFTWNSPSVRIDKTLAVNTAMVRHKEYQFESSDLFETFDWQSRYSHSSGQSSVIQIRLKDKSLTVDDATQQTLLPSAMMVSEVLLDETVLIFINNAFPTVALDILSAEGQIIPCQIRTISASESLYCPEGMVYSARVELLNAMVMEFYFDADKNLLGKAAAFNRGGLLIWKPVQRRDIETHFDIKPIRKGPIARTHFGG